MKLKILLVEPTESIGELISKNFEREFGAEVTAVQSGAAAVEVITKGIFFNLYVTRNFAPEVDGIAEEPIAQMVLNVIYDRALKTPLIVIGEFEHTFKKYALVSDRLRIEEINRLSLKALQLEKKDFAHLRLPDQVPFPIKYFALMTFTPCDVFIRLVKKAGDEYVKRLNCGETFTKEDLKNYTDHGVSELYILKEDREIFMDAFLNQTLKNMKSAKNQDHGVDLAGDSFVISSDLIKTMGFTPACVAMVDQTVMEIRNQILKSDKLGLLLKKILDNELSYAYKRSYLICLFAYKLLPKMEWGSGDQQPILLEKISMVSFFHDIYLEEEHLLKIMDNEQLKNAGLTIKEKDLVVNHANRAALLVQSYPKLPQGIDMIIKQHHGVSNGVGFPEVLTAGISPMAIFFVVVEDFATRVLEVKAVTDLHKAVADIKERYQLPSYRKIVNEIESLFLKK